MIQPLVCYPLVCSILVVLAFPVAAQPKRAALPAMDTSLVRDYSDRPAVRLYLSSKFNSMVVRANEAFTDLRYRPNGNFNMGVGASYRRLTLNIGFPIPFINNDDVAKGRTRFLDAQATLHTQRQATNLFLQVFKGYRITSHEPARIGWDQTTSFPYRPDLVQFNIGLSSLRIVNHARFSYRATFNQDAWQQRSQGTLLYGGYLTCFVVKADSSLVPSLLLSEFRNSATLTKGVFLDAGPMGGYAHTFVYRRGWFFTISGALGAGLSVQRLVLPATKGTSTRVDLGPGWHAQFRAGVGYNSRYRYAGLLFNQEHIGYVLRTQNTFAWDVGNFRLMVVQRLKHRPKRVDRGLRWMKRNSALPVP